MKTEQERDRAVQPQLSEPAVQSNSVTNHWYDAQQRIMQYCLEREAEWARG